jgi:hypothetical protein
MTMKLRSCYHLRSIDFPYCKPQYHPILIFADVRDIGTELQVRSGGAEAGIGEVCVDDENGQCEEQRTKAEFVEVQEGDNTAFSPLKKA